MDDFVFNVKQVGSYPQASAAGINDLLLLQVNGLGGAYNSIAPDLLVGSALNMLASVLFKPGTSINWNGTSLTCNGGAFTFSGPVNAPILSAPTVLINNQPAATVAYVTDALNQIVDNSVWSFNGRCGDIVLALEDVLMAGGAPVTNPSFNGVCTAPTSWNPNANDDTIATTAWVQLALCNWYQLSQQLGTIVTSVNGRGGDVVLQASDITIAATVPGQFAMANTPPTGDSSQRIATTAFVDDSLVNLQHQIEGEFGQVILNQNYAPLASPQFTGIPTAPTAAQTINSGQLATTAFVHNAVTASTTGVSSFNGRTGAVTLTTGDVTTAGGAPLASPIFTGVPEGPTATVGTNTVQLATCAFVEAAIAALPAAVSSFNTRTGAVVLQAADVTGVGGALLASPAFTGAPTAPTAAPATNTTQLATTAYVTAAIAAIPAAVTSFNGRTGAITFQASDVSAVGGALLAGPAFTGAPTAPTATAGTNNTVLATTAFVQAAVTAQAGVTSWNTRTGAVTLTAADLTGVGGALLAGPTFTGVPAAPTAATGTNSTQIATTAFVLAQIAATPVVTTFNGRGGAVTFQASDVSAVGGALLASPAFTGAPTAPTQAPGTNNTDIATTAFVASALAAGGGVTSFNGRAGVVTLTTADVTGAGGAPLASPAFTGTPTVPTAAAGTNNTQAASTAFVAAALAGGALIGFRVFTVSGTYTPTVGMTSAFIMCVGGGGGGAGYTGVANSFYGCASGGAGGVGFKRVTQAQVGASQAVTIGAGGNGSTGTTAATAGTATSVGTLCVANGGGAAGDPLAAGAGGSITGAVGDANFNGQPGEGGLFSNAATTAFRGGRGGNSFYGPGGAGGACVANAGNPGGAGGPGAGGGGASLNNVTTAASGGSGGGGIAMIWEYGS